MTNLLARWRAPLRTLLLSALLLPLAAGLGVGGTTAVVHADGIILPPPCLDLPPLPAPVPLPGPQPADSLEPRPPVLAPAPPVPPIAPLPPLPPVPPFRPIVPCWLTIRYHRVSVDIADQVATTRVDQFFANETGRALEGTYVFPLPDDAAVTSFAMFVDGEKVEGQVLTREEARRLYESIVRRNRDPALLEYVGRGAFQASVFPVPAGGERRIQLEYAQVLQRDGGLVRYTYPLNTEKFSARPLQQAAVTVSIRSTQPIKSVYSPSHEISVTRAGDTQVTASWEQANVTPRTDFSLVYGVSADEVGIHVLTYKPSPAEAGYFLLLAAPPAALQDGLAVPKDVTLVFDTSGSMAGAKIEQAKGALRYVLNSLKPQDRFNIVSFASTVTPFSQSMQPLSERARALAYVDGLVAAGGTNINDALVTALKADAGGRPHTVIFVTDGLPTVGVQQPEQIVSSLKATGARARLFTFGLGYDVNTTLLDTLAAEFGGTSAYVKPNENLEEAVSSFYNKVGTPALTDLALDFGGAQVFDVFPTRLPDLYAGAQLVLAGRYRAPGTFDVTLSGTAASSTQRFTARGTVFAAGPTAGEEALPRLWAGRKIGFLLAEIRLRGASPELVDEVVALATRYGIATPYTSFFVPEPGQPGPTGTPVPAPLTPQARSQAADALRQGVAAAPTAGAAAVQNSEATTRLQQSTAAPAAASEEVRVIGDKTFVLAGDVWIDVSSGQAPPDERVTIAFGSDEYFALLDASPDVARYLAVGARAVIQLGDTWYEITT